MLRVTQGTAGYDFCFSVPKSISIYLAMEGDKPLERMINQAFLETMADAEARMEGRIRGKGEYGIELDANRTTGNMVYACVVHTVTRPIASLERQTIRLKRNRARIQSRRRARDSFDVH